MHLAVLSEDAYFMISKSSINCSLQSAATSLHEIKERKRLDSTKNLTIITRLLEVVSLLGELGSPLQVDFDSSLCCFSLGSLVVLLALEDFFLTFGWSDVFDTDVDALFKNPTIDELVHTDTHCRLGNIEDDPGPAVVPLVGHTLVDGRIGKDVDVVSNLNFHQVLG